MIKTRLAIVAAIAFFAAWHAIETDIETACKGDARCIAASL